MDETRLYNIEFGTHYKRMWKDTSLMQKADVPFSILISFLHTSKKNFKNI